MLTQTKPTSRKPLRFANILTDYADLVVLLPPRPIRTARDAARVEAVVAAMAGFELNNDQSDYFSLLTTLLIDWQTAQDDSDLKKRSSGTVAARLAFLLEESDMTRAELQKLLECGHTLVTLVLQGKRDLSKDSILKLSDHFKVSPRYFM